MFRGHKHCPRCGAAAAKREDVGEVTQACPRCQVKMQSLRLGSTVVEECDRCQGLWLDVQSFEQICADREQQAAVLGGASIAPSSSASFENQIRYVACPKCTKLMNRVNFARCSGVIVDVCRGHGTWFDRDELSRIVEFIRGGGLEASRAKEKASIEEERRRLRQEQLTATRLDDDYRFRLDEDRASGIASARGLLKLLLD